MELLLIYLCTIGLSYFITGTTMFQMVRDIGDSGGKFNVNKLSDLSSLIDPEQKKLNKIMKFVPFLNVLFALKEGMEYIGNKQGVLYQLSTFGAIEEMTDEEKKEYEKHPSALKCFMISAKAEADKKAPKVEIKIDKTENGNKVTVTSQNYSEKDAKLAAQFIKYGLDKFGDLDSFEEALRKDVDNAFKNEFIESLAKSEEQSEEKQTENSEDKGKAYVKRNNGIK